jgi:hypothetical protein
MKRHSSHQGVKGTLAAAVALVMLLAGHPCHAQTPVQTAYFEPDVDTTVTTPFPRVPPSPYQAPKGPDLNLGLPICPAADGTPYGVGNFPGKRMGLPAPERGVLEQKHMPVYQSACMPVQTAP